MNVLRLLAVNVPGFVRMDLIERHTFTETIYLPQKNGRGIKAKKPLRLNTRGNNSKKKKTTLEKPESKPKQPKPWKPKDAKKTVEERLETRREYDRARNQAPERKAYDREQQKRVQAKKAELGLCRDCGNAPIKGQARCEACRDKHRADGRRRNAERRAKRLKE